MWCLSNAALLFLRQCAVNFSAAQASCAARTDAARGYLATTARWGKQIIARSHSKQHTSDLDGFSTRSNQSFINGDSSLKGIYQLDSQPLLTQHLSVWQRRRQQQMKPTQLAIAVRKLSAELENSRRCSAVFSKTDINTENRFFSNLTPFQTHFSADKS